MSAWDESSKGQALLEVHIHPSEWSIEETLSNSTPEWLEYLIRMSQPEQGPNMKVLSLQSDSHASFAKGLRRNHNPIITATSKKE